MNLPKTFLLTSFDIDSLSPLAIIAALVILGLLIWKDPKNFRNK